MMTDTFYARGSPPRCLDGKSVVGDDVGPRLVEQPCSAVSRWVFFWTRIFVKQIVFSLLAAGWVASLAAGLAAYPGLVQAQSPSEGLSRGMSSHGSGGGLSSGSSSNGGLSTGLTSSGADSWGSGSSQGSSVTTSRGGMEIQLSPSIQQAATSQERQDPLSYCYYNNRSYTDGAKLNGQVCVHPGSGSSSDGSTTLSSSPTPMRWIPAAQYVRGKY